MVKLSVKLELIIIDIREPVFHWTLFFKTEIFLSRSFSLFFYLEIVNSSWRLNTLTQRDYVVQLNIHHLNFWRVFFCIFNIHFMTFLVRSPCFLNTILRITRFWYNLGFTFQRTVQVSDILFFPFLWELVFNLFFAHFRGNFLWMFFLEPKKSNTIILVLNHMFGSSFSHSFWYLWPFIAKEFDFLEHFYDFFHWPFALW